jgi:hypothetical protein
VNGGRGAKVKAGGRAAFQMEFSWGIFEALSRGPLGTAGPASVLWDAGAIETTWISIARRVIKGLAVAYDLHVVRTENWLDAATRPVAKGDVDALIASDPELEWSTTNYVDMADEKGVITRYWMITWDGEACFWWYRDQIQCSSPDEAKISKLVQMARSLDARVLGDDGEIYPLQPDEFSAKRAEESKRWPLWKRLIVAFLFGCVLLTLKLLIFGE